MVSEKEHVWITALGEKKKFSELDHQHLSNILWFLEIFRGWNRYNSDIVFLLGLELAKRFPGESGNGEKLPWKPLPIPDEVKWIKNRCKLNSQGDII